MRNGNSGPAMQDALAHRGDRAGVMDVSPKIRAVIHPAQHPLRVRHDVQQTEPRAVRRRAMNGETLVAARLNPHSLLPCPRMTPARLGPGWGDDDRFAEGTRRGD